MSKEPVKIERVKAEAHNTWGIGGDDVMLVFEFPLSWGALFESKHMRPSNKVYVDMNITQAKEFAAMILAAATDAERIDREYSESQAQYDMDHTDHSSDLGVL